MKKFDQGFFYMKFIKKCISKSLDTSSVQIPDDLSELIELIAENTHNVWAEERLRQGWKLGLCRDEQLKTHPCLIPYEDLPEKEKIFDRRIVSEVIKLIQVAGFSIKRY
ncbi:RyR domain-containing protein [uncultured Akkermansia sp.]|uniref:RyR domain-containing protein n=1 Tax=uncultured Akkermansia sp. TaxID=512294 RepID=UPI0025F051CE|nr:RyR domain-containing protein [uncultured Akkermansia sp.]